MDTKEFSPYAYHNAENHYYGDSCNKKVSDGNDNFFQRFAFCVKACKVRFINICLLLILSFNATNAQINLDIIFSTGAGSRQVHDPDASGSLISANHLTFEDSLDIENYLHHLIDSLHLLAFLEASIDSVRYKPGYFRVYVHKGEQYSRVRINPGSVDEELLSALNIRRDRFEREHISIERFRWLQRRLLDWHENSGYPFARVCLENTKAANGIISGDLVVKPNRHYRIDSIHIEGDAAVDRRYLYRHLGIRPGDPYNEQKFRDAGLRIGETPFLNEIREPQIEFMRESADLYLYIDHRRASDFSGILGIMPGDGDRKTRIAGEVNLNLLNVFRKMEHINLHWQAPGNQIQEIDIEIGQPYAFASAFGADVHVHMFRQDTTYMTVGAEAGVPYNMPGGGIVRIFGKTYGTNLIGEGGTVNVAGAEAAEVRGQMAGVSFSRMRIINPVNPMRGWRTDVSFAAGTKRVKTNSTSSTDEKKTGTGEANSHLQWFVPVTRSTTLMLSNLSGIKFNMGTEKHDDHFFANELFLLGGIHTIRGFDERSLAASSYSLQRIEYRYLFEGAGNIFIFFDGMAYKRKLSDRAVADRPFGFGGGITFGTRTGQFSISYALGREFGNPVTFRSSRVHMGIINRF